MSEVSEPWARSAPADMRPSAFRVRPTDGPAGLRDREPSLEVPEARACSMYERIAERDHRGRLDIPSHRRVGSRLPALYGLAALPARREVRPRHLIVGEPPSVSRPATKPTRARR